MGFDLALQVHWALCRCMRRLNSALGALRHIDSTVEQYIWLMERCIWRQTEYIRREAEYIGKQTGTFSAKAGTFSSGFSFPFMIHIQQVAESTAHFSCFLPTCSPAFWTSRRLRKWPTRQATDLCRSQVNFSNTETVFQRFGTFPGLKY